MSSNNAYRYLEKLQEFHYTQKNIDLQKLKNTYSEFMQNHMEQIIEKQFEWKKLNQDPSIIKQEKEQAIQQTKEVFSADRSTPYENPFWFSYLQDLASEIEDSAKDLNSYSEFQTSLSQIGFNLVVKRPFFGTLPTGRVNALTIAVPNTNDHLVVFDDELFVFCNLLCKSVAMAIPFKEIVDGRETFSTNFEDIKNQIENSDSFKRFLDLLYAYFVKNRVSAAQQYVLQGRATTIHKNLLKTMERFILGHEYAHVYGGHLNKHYQTSPASINPSISEVDYMWDQEYSADALGLLLSIVPSVKHQVDPSLIYWGAELFFDAMDIVDRGHSIVDYGNETKFDDSRPPSGSHPTSHDRRIKLRELVIGLYGENPVKLGELLEQIMEYLWEKAKPYLYHLHESKKKMP